MSLDLSQRQEQTQWQVLDRIVLLTDRERRLVKRIRVCGRALVGVRTERTRLCRNHGLPNNWRVNRLQRLMQIASMAVLTLLVGCKAAPKPVVPYQSPLGVPLIDKRHTDKAVLIRESTPVMQPAAIFAAPALPTTTWLINDPITLCEPSEQVHWRFNVRSSNTMTTKPKLWPVVQTIPVNPPQFSVIRTNVQQFYCVTLTNVALRPFTNGVYEFTIGNNRQPFK